MPRVRLCLRHRGRGQEQARLIAGLRAEDFKPAQQELWVSAAVIAGRAEDVLDAGFAASHESRQAIRLKAIRSGAWRDVEGRL